MVPLGVSWGHLGSSWGPRVAESLECPLRYPLWAPSWGRPGALLGHLRALLGRVGASGVVLGPSWMPSWSVLGPLGRLLGPSWSHLGLLKTRIAEMLKNATPPTRNAHFCRQDEAKMGPRWAKLGSSWPKLSPSWSQVGILRRSCRHLAVLARLEGVLEGTGAVLGGSWGVLGQ